MNLKIEDYELAKVLCKAMSRDDLIDLVLAIDKEKASISFSVDLITKFIEYLKEDLVESDLDELKEKLVKILERKDE